MPLPMVHLNVAQKLLPTLPITNPADYYLGTISPDAIHMRENADRPAKIATHLNPTGKWSDVDEAGFTNTMLTFIQTHKTDFAWGYAIHILTDMLWTRSLYYDFGVKYAADPSPIQGKSEAYYNDTDLADLALYASSPWQPKVWQLLSTAIAPDFANLLTATEIKKWNDRTLNWFDENKTREYNPIKYITQADIDSFIDTCAKIISERIAQK